MKNLCVLILSTVLLLGCVSPQVKSTVERQAARGDNMVSKIDNESTTREEEQSYIRAMRIVWWSLNHDINGVDLPPDIVEFLNKLDLLENGD